MSVPVFSLEESRIALDCPRQFVILKKRNISTYNENNKQLGNLLQIIVAKFAKNALESKKFQASLATDSIEGIKQLFFKGLHEIFVNYYTGAKEFNFTIGELQKVGDSLLYLANELSLRFIKLDTAKNPTNTLKKLFLAINYHFKQELEVIKNQSIKMGLEGFIDWISVNPEDNSLNVINFVLTPVEQVEKDINTMVLFALVLEKKYNIPVSATLMYYEGKEIILKNINFDVIDKFKEKVLQQIILINQWSQMEDSNSEIPATAFISTCKECIVMKSCLTNFGTNSNLEMLGFDLLNSNDKEVVPSEFSSQTDSREIIIEPEKVVLDELIVQASKIRGKEPLIEDISEVSKKGRPDQSLIIGSRLNTEIPVKINPISLLKHVITIGATGSGKTVLGKIIIEEALAQNIPCILIDPQGDLCSLALPNDEVGIQLRKKMQLKIFTPNSSKGIPFSINLLKAPLRELLVDDDYFRTILDSTAKLLLDIAGYTKKKITAEKALIEAILKEDWNNGISHTMQSLAERIEGTTTIFSVQDSAEINTESLLTKKAKNDLSKNIMKLAVGTDSAFFTGSYGIDIKKMLNKPACNIINLASVGTDPNKRQLVVSWILRLIYDWLLRKPQKNQDKLRFLL